MNRRFRQINGQLLPPGISASPQTTLCMVCGLTRVQDVRQDGDDTQLTVATRLLHHVFVDDLNGEGVGEAGA